MKLTGKCKEDFEGWLQKYLWDYEPEIILQYEDISESLNSDCLSRFPDSMKYGVYVDYFDSVGGRIEIMRHSIDDMWGCYINGAVQGVRLKSRHEARTKAIERANEIRNEQKN